MWKELKKTPTSVKVLFGVCILLLLITIFWPTKKRFVELVPIPLPGSPIKLYMAKVEPFKENKPEFVLFHQEWCGYCKRMMGAWDALKHSVCKLIKIDCDKEKDTAKKHGIKGYPTIRYFPYGMENHEDFVEYKGERETKAFEDFINSQLK